MGRSVWRMLERDRLCFGAARHGPAPSTWQDGCHPSPPLAGKVILWRHGLILKCCLKLLIWNRSSMEHTKSFGTYQSTLKCLVWGGLRKEVGGSVHSHNRWICNPDNRSICRCFRPKTAETTTCLWGQLINLSILIYKQQFRMILINVVYAVYVNHNLPQRPSKRQQPDQPYQPNPTTLLE